MKSKNILIVGAVLMFSVASSAQTVQDERETAAVSVMTADEIGKNSTPNPYDAMYGMLPGLSAMQRLGWNSVSDLYLRGGGSPLIVVDGFPRPMEYLATVEIESVKVLKDGAATAIWGPRGANGVVMITTKRGNYESRELSVNYTHGMGFTVNQPEFADGYTYAAARNEALYYDGLPLQYSQTDLAAFRSGAYPDLFSNTNWMEEALRNHTVNNQLDIVLRGGGKKLRYFTSISYKNDYGILEPKYTKNERYNNQFRQYALNLRMNIDVDLTPNTLVQWTMFGALQEQKRPLATSDDIFSLIYNTPSAMFPVRTSSGHWGGDLVFKRNPVANISDRGYYKANPRILSADMRIVQDLKNVTPGLSAELAVAYDNIAVFKEDGTKTYSYEVNTPLQNLVTGAYDPISQVYDTDGMLKVNCHGMEEQSVAANVLGRLNYNRSFGKHVVDASALYKLEYYSSLGQNNTTKRLYATAMAGYNYDSRYMVDATVSYVGTSRLQKTHHYKAYPSVAAAWLVSKEKFMRNVSAIGFLKLRASWGQAGYDGISYDLHDQTWSNTNGYFFGENNSVNKWNGGMILGTPAIKGLTLERVNKYNAGLDIQLFKRLALTADAYLHQYRQGLIGAGNFYSDVVGLSVPMQNIGATDRRGFEISALWNDKIGKDFNYYVGVNVSRMKSKVVENGEGYKEYLYLSAKGLPVGQIFGLEAIGYFRDQADIESSPVQNFSEVRPGDIKYRDQNGDKVIDSKDVVAIGHSETIPEWYGGLRLGLEYKGFGLDLVFQGATGLSRKLDMSSVYRPLRNNTNVSMWYLNDKVRWTEQTKDIANMPRLSTLDNANNYQTSTQWLVDGSFLKLRNVNVYYNLPEKWIAPLRMSACQVYVRGNNLFSVDHVPYLNCESINANYQDLMSVYAGVNVKF